jgi:hypothetical protein
MRPGNSAKKISPTPVPMFGSKILRHRRDKGSFRFIPILSPSIRATQLEKIDLARRQPSNEYMNLLQSQSVIGKRSD